MKKFLSLVLALVMTMSLVTISAGAKDFTDDKSITYGEAVDVVSAIGIVDGYTDGSFNPSATLTRGAAAKIICNLLLGPTTASALVADAAPYSDVPTSNVFSGYIAYCAQQGIISGYADGTFRPAGTLTSYAFMKMLLGALGYNSEVEGFVGANWSVQVAKTALGIGLDKGLADDFNGIKPVTREEAALYAFNTLQGTMVEYDSTTTVNVNGATVTVGGSKAKFVEAAFDTNKDNIKRGDNYIQFGERYFTKLKLNENQKDAFQRPCNEWTYKGDKIGTYAKTPDASYTKKVSEADIYADCGLTSTTKNFDVFVDGIAANVYDNVNLAANINIRKGDEDHKIGTGNGAIVEVYKPTTSNGTGTIAIINTYVGEVVAVEEATAKRAAYIELGPVGNRSSAYDTPATTGSLTALDATIKFETEKFEVGDIVTFNYSFVTGSEAVKNVQATEAVTGTVKSFTTDKKFSLDGTTYEYGAKMAKVFGSADISTETTVYVDSNGYVLFSKEGKDNNKNYALVLQAGTAYAVGSNGYKAELLFTDGTTKVVDTNKNYGDNNNATWGNGADGSRYEGQWVTYKTNSKGEYVLTVPAASTSNFSAGSKVLTVNGQTRIDLYNGTSTINKKVNSTTTVIVKDNNDNIKVYEGIKNMPTISDGAASPAQVSVDAYSAYGTGTFLKFLYVDANSTTRISNGTDKAIFLVRDTAATKVVTDSDEYYVFDAVVDGKIVEDGVMLDSTDSDTRAVIADLIAGNDVALKSYSVDSNGFYTVTKGASNANVVTAAAFHVEKVSGTCIDFDNGNAYYTADNCVFYRVDAAGNLKKATISGLRTADIGVSEYYKAVSYTVNSDQEITGVYWSTNY